MTADGSVSSLAGRRAAREVASPPRTWGASEFGVDRLLAAKDEAITLILPAREVAETIGAILSAVAPSR